MAKGHNGETLKEAIVDVIGSNRLKYSEVFQTVKQRGWWKDDTIYQHMMSLVVNLPPARDR